jgi:hypothetical protein
MHSPNSFPPIVINITDGTVADSPLEGADLEEWAGRLRRIRTRDGCVLLLNVFLSDAEQPWMWFPTSAADLPEPGRRLLRMSRDRAIARSNHSIERRGGYQGFSSAADPRAKLGLGSGDLGEGFAAVYLH